MAVQKESGGKNLPLFKLLHLTVMARERRREYDNKPITYYLTRPNSFVLEQLFNVKSKKQMYCTILLNLF